MSLLNGKKEKLTISQELEEEQQRKKELKIPEKEIVQIVAKIIKSSNSIQLGTIFSLNNKQKKYIIVAGDENMIEKLDKDMIEAMKNKEKDRLTVIRMVKASLKQEQIDHKKEINDELLIDVVNKQIKMRKDSVAEFEKGNRQDLIDKTQEEIKVLLAYLPEQLSQEEVEKIIDEIFAEVKPEGPKDMGKVMGLAQAKLKGKADMKEVSTIIRGKLQ